MMRAAQTGGRLRIIGGSLRGSKLDVPNAQGLRPTPDRVRETLFNWLMPVIDGARCLDLFAGTGALGIEALSRGAAAVDFVESDAQLAALLRANLSRLKQTATVHAMSASRFIESAHDGYDIVFVDPPFAENLWESTMAAIEAKSLLAETAWIYVESPAEHFIASPAHWQIHRERRAGAVRYALYRRVMPSAKL
ncbi:MAG TPA: 16S rRNA (guanine(966)-N(2))-methyltransferase RsmD [Rudaea sp.]|jgi:16S rRNA (guanine966-N2)-methyltransferase|nr:16S rRNA (guanine(966)-N(2))-methyltransferase RsmD [Rudaea sp.]